MKADILILAGGKSSRMGGKHKGDLSCGNESFTQRLISELKDGANQLWLSYGEIVRTTYPECRIVTDEFPGCGPMGGLHAGLNCCESNVLWVAACDMPRLKRELYGYLASFLGDHLAVVPLLDGRPQPLAAIYTKEMQSVFETCLHAGNFRLRSALDQADICYVDITDQPQFCLMLQNINTEEEYRSFLKESE